MALVPEELTDRRSMPASVRTGALRQVELYLSYFARPRPGTADLTTALPDYPVGCPAGDRLFQREQGGDGGPARAALEAVRWELDLLASSRLNAPFDPQRERSYEELCARELELLRQPGRWRGPWLPHIRSGR